MGRVAPRVNVSKKSRVSGLSLNFKIKLKIKGPYNFHHTPYTIKAILSSWENRDLSNVSNGHGWSF